MWQSHLKRHFKSYGLMCWETANNPSLHSGEARAARGLKAPVERKQAPLNGFLRRFNQISIKKETEVSLSLTTFVSLKKKYVQALKLGAKIHNRCDAPTRILKKSDSRYCRCVAEYNLEGNQPQQRPARLSLPAGPSPCRCPQAPSAELQGPDF